MTRAALVILIACGSAPRPAPAKSVQVNAPGAPVDLAAVIEPGYVTVVDFWSESCGACVVVGGLLAVGVASEPSVVIRKIDVGDGLTTIAKTYDITALPHFRIYDKRGRFRHKLVGNDCQLASQYAKRLAAE